MTAFRATEQEIENDFTMEMHHFDTFLEGVKKKWPSESQIISEQLNHFSRRVSGIAQKQNETAPPSLIPGPELLHSLDALDLADNSTISRDENVPPFGGLLDNSIPSSDPGQAPRPPLASYNLLRQSMAFATHTATPTIDPSLGMDSCEVLQISPNPVIDNRFPLSFPCDTINPTMLNVNWQPSHYNSVQITAINRFLPSISPVCTTSTSPAAFEEQALSAGSAKKRPRNPRQATTRDKFKEGQSKRVRLSRGYELIQPDLLQQMQGLLEDGDAERLPLMCDLYLAIGAEDSVAQLKDVIAAMRESNLSILGCDLCSAVSIVRKLETMETMQHTIAFLRRILLLRLLQQRDERFRKVRKGNPSLPAKKIQSIVIDELTREIYPNSDESDEKFAYNRKRLGNRFFSGKTWKEAIDRFGLGILALIPTGGEFHIQNQDFEYLPDDHRRILFNFLEQKGNGYLLKAAKQLTPFVQAVYDGTGCIPRIRVECVESFTSGPMDSLKVIELCSELPPGEGGEQ